MFASSKFIFKPKEYAVSHHEIICKGGKPVSDVFYFPLITDTCSGVPFSRTSSE